eukprot:4529266-Heterocapsa_arctica.AAC.1
MVTRLRDPTSASRRPGAERLGGVTRRDLPRACPRGGIQQAQSDTAEKDNARPGLSWEALARDLETT